MIFKVFLSLPSPMTLFYCNSQKKQNSERGACETIFRVLYLGKLLCYVKKYGAQAYRSFLGYATACSVEKRVPIGPKFYG